MPYIFDIFAKVLCWIYYLDDFIAFLPSNVNLIFYKDYFNFLYKILNILNNKKKKKQG